MVEVFLYLLFGVLTTLISYGSFYFFYKVVFNYGLALGANCLSFILATLFAFLTNKKYVFKSKDWSLATLGPEVVQFFSFRLFTFFIEELGLLLAEWFLDPSVIYFSYQAFSLNGIMLAKIALSFLAVLLNYLFSKFLIFKRK